jgi:hypothetical protein
MKGSIVASCALGFCCVTSAIAAAAQDQAATIPVQDLLATASKSFHQNESLRPTDFRNVHVRLLDRPDGDKQYVLCGEFLPAQGMFPSGLWWLSFATVLKPKPTQWTGADATGLCQRATAVGDKQDLSPSLLHLYGS